MRFIFKTRYEQDLQIFKHGVSAAWYAALLAFLLIAPLIVPDYYRTQLIFIFIYSICGFGLMLLSGFTGQISMGHAAFLAVGAYTECILQAAGWPFVLSAPAAVLLAAIAGVIIGLPALRLTGIYLAIATLAFGFVVEEVLARWESVTGGNSGKMVPSVKLLTGKFDNDVQFYYLSLVCVLLVGFAVFNLLRSPTGRAFIAIRDSEVSAQSMGVNLSSYKTLSFALSAGITGLAGALYAHQIRFLSPQGLPAAGGGRADRPEDDDLRDHHDLLRAVRAAGHLRPVAEDPYVLLAVPAVQARDVQAPEGVPEIRAGSLTP